MLFKAGTLWVWMSHCRPFGGRSLPYPFPAALPEEGPFTVIVLLPWDTTGCSGRSGLSRGYLSLGQQLTSPTAQGFTASFPDKNEESEAFSPFLCPWTEALLETCARKPACAVGEPVPAWRTWQAEKDFQFAFCSCWHRWSKRLIQRWRPTSP